MLNKQLKSFGFNSIFIFTYIYDNKYGYGYVYSYGFRLIDHNFSQNRMQLLVNILHQVYYTNLINKVINKYKFKIIIKLIKIHGNSNFGIALMIDIDQLIDFLTKNV